MDTIAEKQKHLLDSIHSRKISASWHNSKTSVLEGVFARGDRRLGKVLLKAWKSGCRLDSWDECFDFEKWQQAMEDCGLTMDFYASRRRSFDEIFPWSHLDYGVSETFLKRENEKAKNAEVTPQCRLQCSGCGANQLIGGKCFV